MKLNLENEGKFNAYVADFIRQVAEGGAKKGYEHHYAVTELIAEEIRNKKYKIYQGNNIYPDGSEVLKYDVVCVFGLSNDPSFYVCTQEDGDSCTLVRCNKDGLLVSREY